MILQSPLICPLISCLRTQTCKLHAHLPPPPAVVEQLIIDERVSGSPNLDGPEWGVLSTFFTTSHSVSVGGCYYMVTFVLLMLWDYIVMPWLQDREIISVDDSLESIRPTDALTHKERELPWITVLTADKAVPLPTRNELKSMPSSLFFVGNIDTVVQFITLSAPTKGDVKGAYEYSDEWSTHLNLPRVYMVKKRRW